MLSAVIPSEGGISSVWTNLGLLRWRSFGLRLGRHCESAGPPTTVSISQARARSSSGSAMNAAKERSGPWCVAFFAPAFLRGL